MFLELLFLLLFGYFRQENCDVFENEDNCRISNYIFGHTECVWGRVGEIDKCINILDIKSCSEFIDENGCNTGKRTGIPKLERLYCEWDKENSSCIFNIDIKTGFGIILFISIGCGYTFFLIILNCIYLIKTKVKQSGIKREEDKDDKSYEEVAISDDSKTSKCCFRSSSSSSSSSSYYSSSRWSYELDGSSKDDPKRCCLVILFIALISLIALVIFASIYLKDTLLYIVFAAALFFFVMGFLTFCCKHFTTFMIFFFFFIIR
jgi:hypothetical protein